MNDVIVYVITIQGSVNEGEINALSPVQVQVELAGPQGARLTAHTDQSGIIALIRHLHNLGLIFDVVRRTGTPGVPDGSVEE